MKKSPQIHPTAIITPGAAIGDGVVIEPYAVINSPHVVLEEGVVIKSHVYHRRPYDDWVRDDNLSGS